MLTLVIQLEECSHWLESYRSVHTGLNRVRGVFTLVIELEECSHWFK